MTLKPRSPQILWTALWLAFVCAATWGLLELVNTVAGRPAAWATGGVILLVVLFGMWRARK
jgi:hypothetical protein